MFILGFEAHAFSSSAGAANANTWLTDVIIFVISTRGGGGGRGIPLYNSYRYMRSESIWFFSRFGLK